MCRHRPPPSPPPLAVCHSRPPPPLPFAVCCCRPPPPPPLQFCWSPFAVCQRPPPPPFAVCCSWPPFADCHCQTRLAVVSSFFFYCSLSLTSTPPPYYHHHLPPISLPPQLPPPQLPPPQSFLVFWWLPVSLLLLYLMGYQCWPSRSCPAGCWICWLRPPPLARPRWNNNWIVGVCLHEFGTFHHWTIVPIPYQCEAAWLTDSPSPDLQSSPSESVGKLPKINYLGGESYW